MAAPTPGNGVLVRALLFLALAIFFVIYALMLEAGTFRTMLYVFAGIDILWGGALLTSYFRNRRK